MEEHPSAYPSQPPDTLLGVALFYPTPMAKQGQCRALPALAKTPSRGDLGTPSQLLSGVGASLTLP